MNEATVARVPAWFRMLAVLGLLWNLFGVAMYLHSVGIFGDPMVGLSDAERAAAAAIPPWIMGAFAIGTFAGLIGSIGLVVGRKWAWPSLLVSLIALLVLEGWAVFLSGDVDDHGIALPLTVVLGAVLLVWMAHQGRQRGWLR